MAGVPQSSALRDASLPVHDPGNAPLLDFIAKSAKTIQRTELVVAILSWVVAAVGLLLGLILVDHWVWPLNEPARYVAWFSFVAGSLLWTATRVVPLLGRRINPEFAAKKIESIFPEIKDGLISWLQLATRDATISRGVLNAVGRFAFQHLRGQDAGQIVDQFAPIKLMAMLVGFVLMGSVYLAVAPKSGSATLYRILMPWAKIAPATRVQILDVSPGHATVTEGSNLRVAIQVRGWRKTDVAEIVYSTDDGQTMNQIIPMQADLEGLTYITDFGSSFGGIVQPMTYSIRAGDAEAGPYSVKVQAIPLVIMDRVEYHYPKYMRMKPRLIEGDGAIEGPEGTRVMVEAHANQPPHKGRLEFDFKPNPERPFQVSKASDVKLDERNISGEWYLELDELKSNPTVAAYRLRFENSLGESNASPIVYPIKVIPDLAPEIDFTGGVKDELELPIDQTLKLTLRGLDPDFGLTKLSLRAVLNGHGASTKELFSDEAGVVGQILRDYTLDPAALKLRPGNTIEFTGAAQDNRCGGKDEHPEPNVRLSRTIRVTIKEPVGPAKSNADDQSTKPDVNPSGSSESETKPEGKKPPTKDGKQADSKGANDNGSKPNQDIDDGKQKPNEPKGSESAVKQPSDSSSASSESPQSKQGDKQPSPPSGDNHSQPSKSDDSTSGKSSQPQSSQGQSSGDQQSGDQQSSGQQSGSQENSSNSQQQSGGSQAGSSGSSNSASSSGDSSSGGSSSTGQSGKQPGETNSSPSTSASGSSGESDAAQDKNGAPSGKTDSGANAGSSKSSRSDSGAPSTDSSRGQGESVPRDMHDGEAFERLQEWLEKNQPSSKSIDSSSKSESAKQLSEGGNPSEGGPTTSSQKNSDSTVQGSKPKSESANGNGGEGKQGSDSQSSPSGDRSKSIASSQNSDGKAGDENSKTAEGAAQKGNESGNGANSESSSGQPSSAGGKESSAGGKESSAGGKESSAGGKESSAGGKESSGSESSGSESGSQSSKSGSQNSSSGNSASASTGEGKTNGSEGKSPAESGAKSSSNSSSNSNKSGNPTGPRTSGSTDNISEDAGTNVPESAEKAEAELEYARQATDMVLKALDRQKNQPEPDLLKRMGWTKEQLQSFIDRWSQARDESPDPTKRRQHDDALRSLGLIPGSDRAKSSQERNDQLRGMKEEGSRVQPPESIRERYEAFKKSSR